MARWNKIDEMLDNLSDFRNNNNWSDFFETIEEIRSLDFEINEEMHNDPCDTSEMDKNVKSKIAWLEKNKEKFAQLTKTKEQYDAVYDIVAEISDEFAHLA